MSTNHPDAGAEPLTDAELDLLATLDAKRTPGPLAAHVYGPLDAWVRVAATTEAVVHCGANASNGANDARAIAAALNALPALLAEVRRGRATSPAPAPAPWAEPDGDDGADVASDDGPRMHIPRDLLTRPEGPRR